MSYILTTYDSQKGLLTQPFYIRINYFIKCSILVRTLFDTFVFTLPNRFLIIPIESV